MHSSSTLQPRHTWRTHKETPEQSLVELEDGMRDVVRKEHGLHDRRNPVQHGHVAIRLDLILGTPRCLRLGVGLEPQTSDRCDCDLCTRPRGSKKLTGRACRQGCLKVHAARALSCDPPLHSRRSYKSKIEALSYQHAASQHAFGQAAVPCHG